MSGFVGLSFLRLRVAALVTPFPLIGVLFLVRLLGSISALRFKISGGGYGNVATMAVVMATKTNGLLFLFALFYYYYYFIFLYLLCLTVLFL